MDSLSTPPAPPLASTAMDWSAAQLSQEGSPHRSEGGEEGLADRAFVGGPEVTAETDEERELVLSTGDDEERELVLSTGDDEERDSLCSQETVAPEEDKDYDPADEDPSYRECQVVAASSGPPKVRRVASPGTSRLSFIPKESGPVSRGCVNEGASTSTAVRPLDPIGPSSISSPPASSHAMSTRHRNPSAVARSATSTLCT